MTISARYPIQVDVCSTDKADRMYYGQFPLRDAKESLLVGGAALSSRFTATLSIPSDCLQHRETIVVILREALLGEVPALAASGLFMYNDTSRDLLESRTFVEFAGEHVRVRLRADSLGQFVDPVDEEFRRFDMLWVCGPLVFISRHMPSRDDADAMLADLQGCAMSAGCNYDPSRVWSAQDLQDAKQAPAPRPLHGLITAVPFAPAVQRRATLGLSSVV